MPMPSIDTTIPWPTNWTKNYNDNVACAASFKPDNKTIDPNCGILQVTVDFSGTSWARTDLDPKSQCLAGQLLHEIRIRLRLQPQGQRSAGPGRPRAQGCQRQSGLLRHQEGRLREGLQPMGGQGSGFPRGRDRWASPSRWPLDPDDQGYLHRPIPQPFPTTKDRNPQISQPDPDWLTMFANTAVDPDNSKGGACFYARLPTNGPGACQIP